MIEKIDFSKIENSHIKPLDFEVIEKAAKGDSESIRLVIVLSVTLDDPPSGTLFHPGMRCAGIS